MGFNHIFSLSDKNDIISQHFCFISRDGMSPEFKNNLTMMHVCISYPQWSRRKRASGADISPSVPRSWSTTAFTGHAATLRNRAHLHVGEDVQAWIHIYSGLQGKTHSIHHRSVSTSNGHHGFASGFSVVIWPLITHTHNRFIVLLHDAWDIECKYSFWECKYTAILHGSTTDCTAVVSVWWNDVKR